MKKTVILTVLWASALMISSVSANTTGSVATGSTTTSVATGTVLTGTVTSTWSVATTWTVVNTGAKVETWVSTDDLIMTLMSSTTTGDSTTGTVEMTWAEMTEMVTTTAVAKPADVDQETWDAGNKMYTAKVTKLSPEKTSFYKGLTRWEAALLLKRFGVEQLSVESKKTATECTFSDVANIDAEAKTEIQESCTYGLFKGNNAKFMPDARFTRGQAIMVIARMLNGDATMELDDSYDYLLTNKVIKVDDRKDSEREVTRSELYIMISRILDQKEAGTLPTVGAGEAQQLINLMNDLIEDKSTTTTEVKDGEAASLTGINLAE